MPYKDPEKAKEYGKQHYKNNKAKYQKQNHKNYLRYKENGTIKRPDKEYMRQYREANAEHLRQLHRESHLRRVYGISIEEYDEMYTRQSGKCKICHGKFEGTPNVDHDHATGEVRGLLCGKCNAGIGYFSENVTWLARAIEYLNDFRKS